MCPDGACLEEEILQMELIMLKVWTEKSFLVLQWRPLTGEERQSSVCFHTRMQKSLQKFINQFYQ